MVEELVGRTVLVDHAIGEEQYTAAHLTGKAHLVGDDNHRHALPGQPRHHA